ncbi:periplasmic heavy metal sensor [Mesorhizobium sp.]|uniref:periplasmic heavy metal sensor n=1 Tax=Mesorhizobium sp. TaxID=1871066 RepID=UPI00345C4AAE
MNFSPARVGASWVSVVSVAARPAVSPARTATRFSPEVRKEFRSIRRANCPRTLAALRELRIARATLAAAQQASPFGEAAVKDAMAAVRTATTNVQAKVQDYLLTALKRPSPLPEVDAGGACPPKVSAHRRTAGLQTR